MTIEKIQNDIVYQYSKNAPSPLKATDQPFYIIQLSKFMSTLDQIGIFFDNNEDKKPESKMKYEEIFSSLAYET